MKPKITQCWLLGGGNETDVNIQNVLHFHQTNQENLSVKATGRCYVIILADPDSTCIQEIWPKSCITGMSWGAPDRCSSYSWSPFALVFLPLNDGPNLLLLNLVITNSVVNTSDISFVFMSSIILWSEIENTLVIFIKGQHCQGSAVKNDDVVK